MGDAHLGFTLGDADDAILNSHTSDLRIWVGGFDKTPAVHLADCRLELALGQSSRFAFTVNSRLTGSGAPAIGNSVIVNDDGQYTVLSVPVPKAARWFVGFITELSVRIDRAAETVLYDCVAEDTRWLLDGYARVRGVWWNQGINTIARDIIADFTDPTPNEFVLGYAPDSLGTLDQFVAEDELVSSVLTRLAEAAGAYWEIGELTTSTGGSVIPINIFTTPAHKSAGTVTLSNTSNNVAALTITRDYTDIATKVIATGGGTTLRAAVTAGTTTYLYVYSTTEFPASGTLLVGTDVVTYSGSTTVPGSEAFVSLSGLTRDWPIGTPVRPRVTVEDATAQSALTSAMVLSTTGIMTKYLRDDAWRPDEASTQATAALTLLKSGVTTVSGTMIDQQHTDATNCWPGATLACSMTTPVSLTGTYRIQRVTMTPMWLGGGPTWQRTFSAGPVARGTELYDLLGGA